MSAGDEQGWKVLVLILKKTAAYKQITHAQIAETTGYQKNNITRVFSLKYKPRLDVFLNIARAIGVNFFFEDKDGDTPWTDIFNQAMDELGRLPKPPSN